MTYHYKQRHLRPKCPFEINATLGDNLLLPTTANVPSKFSSPRNPTMAEVHEGGKPISCLCTTALGVMLRG